MNMHSSEEQAITNNLRKAITKMANQSTMDKMYEILQINPDAKFYLATDNDKTKMDFVGKYGNGTVMSNPRPASRNSLDGIKDAVAEMFILANASKIYGSFYSSFSEAAAIIGNTPLTQLYKP